MFKLVRSFVQRIAGPGSSRKSLLETLGYSRIYKNEANVNGQGVAPFSSDTGSHIPDDWKNMEKVKEDMWIHKTEQEALKMAASKANVKATPSAVPYLPKEMLSLVEMELEDVLADEYITPAAKVSMSQAFIIRLSVRAFETSGLINDFCLFTISPSHAPQQRIMDWKLKLWECMAKTPTPPATPFEQTIAAQKQQAEAMGQLERLLHTDGINLADSVKKKLVDWKMSALTV